jgi:hypothetical protein
MYTLQKNHVTWQQTVSHEKRDRLNFKLKNDKQYYDANENEQYLNNMYLIKMKKFYGKHLNKYMQDTVPIANQGGIYEKPSFAPL